MRLPPAAPDTQPHRVEEFHNRWEQIGVSTIPLKENSKVAWANDWPNVPSSEMWWEANQLPFRKNIGVRCGKLQGRGASLAVIDMDNKKSREAVTGWLDAQGLSPATVRTYKRGRRHAYLLVNVPESVSQAHHSNKLPSSVGSGEFRYGSGAYVVSPCSQMDSKFYIFMVGNMETFATQPVVEWSDLQWLTAETTNILGHQPDTPISTLPITLQRRDTPRLAMSLLPWLVSATRGQGYTTSLRNYPSRSEGEAACVTDMILAGWELDDIVRWFEHNSPAKYKEQKRHRFSYLKRTHRNVIAWLCNPDHPTRPFLAEEYQQAITIEWPHSRTHHVDQAVTAGLLALCWRFGSREVHAGVRTISETAFVTPMTAGRALKRLQKQGVIERREPADYNNRVPALWSYLGLHGIWTKCYISHNASPIEKREKSRKTSVATESVQQAGKKHESKPADYGLASKYAGVWGLAGGLTRSSRLVYRAVAEASKPLTCTEIAEQVGRHRRTVGRGLARLLQHSLVGLVDDGRYALGNVTITELAHVLGIEELAKKRRNQHKRDRQLYEGWLAFKKSARGTETSAQDVPIPASQERF